jgi:hypothetical protein
MTAHLAVFSVSATGAYIAVTPKSAPYDAVAVAQPSIVDDPLAALRDLGYQLAYPHHRSLFRKTMKATGYQNVPVVSVS